MKKVIIFIGELFKPECVSCRRKATTVVNVSDLDTYTFDALYSGNRYVRMAVDTGKEIKAFHLCRVCNERLKIESQVHAEREKARLDELAKKEYYENLKIAVELKELEQRAKELGVETKDLSNSKGDS